MPLIHRFTGATHMTRGLLAVMVLAVLVEIGWRLVRGHGYDRAEAAATAGVAVGNILIGVGSSLIVGAAYFAVWAITPIHWPLGDWRTWAIGFVLVELIYYWFHRLSHQVRWMWASHQVHHSPRQLTFLSAVRLSWTNLISGGWLLYIPLVLLGFDPRLVLAVLALDLHYQFFLHTEAVRRLGPLEWVLNTPSHHRVHHATNPAYLDRNYGGMVIVFDRLFGTFAPERVDDPVVYGLVHAPADLRPHTLALGEWRRLLADMLHAGGPVKAVKVALGRPG
jgi:sterol desaturase/sphingolipid hydroxylase (fatty acid hydroxylase superfamily)